MGPFNSLAHVVLFERAFTPPECVARGSVNERETEASAVRNVSRGNPPVAVVHADPGQRIKVDLVPREDPAPRRVQVQPADPVGVA